MHAEPHHAHCHQCQQADGPCERQRDALSPGGGGEHQERQHQSRGQLDADARRQRRHGRPWALPGSRRQRQRRRQRRQHQRVVVRAADGQHQQHRVQAHERRGPASALAESARGARDQRDRAEARDGSHHLHRPQPAREPHRGCDVAGEREQRPVGGVLEGPADERVDGIRGRFGGHVRVGVQAVQRAHPRERQVAEDVLGDQRRTQHQDQVCQHDRARQRRERQRSCRGQHQQVAGAHDQHQRLEAVTAEAHAQVLQRTRQPTGPAAAASRHVLRRRAGGARAQQEDRRQDAEQAQRAQCAHDASRRPRAGGAASLRAHGAGNPNLGHRSRRLHGAIVTSARAASLRRDPIP